MILSIIVAVVEYQSDNVVTMIIAFLKSRAGHEMLIKYNAAYAQVVRAMLAKIPTQRMIYWSNKSLKDSLFTSNLSPSHIQYKFKTNFKLCKTQNKF